jgi:hypothetical protein
MKVRTQKTETILKCKTALEFRYFIPFQRSVRKCCSTEPGLSSAKERILAAEGAGGTSAAKCDVATVPRYIVFYQYIPLV